MTMAMLMLLVIAVSLASCQGRIPQHIKSQSLLLQPSAATKLAFPDINCLSWRVANEAHNIIDWVTIPEECVEYVKDYMLGNQYHEDSKFVIDEAISYVSTLPLPRDGRNLWVFDIDETCLSLVSFFFNQSSSDEELFFPALPETLRLYSEVLSHGIKVVFLTGRPEEFLEGTAFNLKEVGYHSWFKLILRSGIFENLTAKEYKSTIRTYFVEQGYRIVGNIGDQWSDISGPNSGWRVFKLPNPMYYLP